uniref:Uncharacterized protein n=1 Tax=Oryza rufipogon TaxID=4529 RepID=A0A0E0NUS3_ORYRU
MMCYRSAAPELFHDKSDMCRRAAMASPAPAAASPATPAILHMLCLLSGGGRAPTCRGNARPHPRSSVCASLAGHRAPPRCAGTGYSTAARFSARSPASVQQRGRRRVGVHRPGLPSPWLRTTSPSARVGGCPSSQVLSVRLTGRPPCPTTMRRYRLLHRSAILCS